MLFSELAADAQAPLSTPNPQVCYLYSFLVIATIGTEAGFVKPINILASLPYRELTHTQGLGAKSHQM